MLSIHGTPGCRLNRWPTEEPFLEAGVRLLSVDRAGYGHRTRQPGRRVVDAVADVEALVDALGVDRFVVTGGSGGGPHALAVAARLGPRVVRSHCEVGVAPYEVLEDWTAGMDPQNVEEFAWTAAGEEVLESELRRVDAEMRADLAAGDPMAALPGFELSDADRAVMVDARVQAVLRAVIPEQTRGGVRGGVDDDLAFLAPWGFDVAEIAVPVLVRVGGATCSCRPPTDAGSPSTFPQRRSSSRPRGTSAGTPERSWRATCGGRRGRGSGPPRRRRPRPELRIGPGASRLAECRRVPGDRAALSPRLP